MSDIEPDRVVDPSEATLRMVHTRADLRDYLGWQRWYEASDYFPHGAKAKAVWESLPESERASWIDGAVRKLEEFLATSPDQQEAHNRMSLRAMLHRNSSAIPVTHHQGRETDT